VLSLELCVIFARMIFKQNSRLDTSAYAVEAGRVGAKNEITYIS